MPIGKPNKRKMWRVSFLVSSKYFEDVLEFCAGKVGDLQNVPVKEADDRPIGIILGLAHRTQITAREIGELLAQSGGRYQASSVSYVIKQARDAGLIRPRGGKMKGIYDIVRKGAK